jgi:branched-chain amino acid aminotransferase
LAAAQGYQQNLWLLGDEHQLTEVGNTNLFILLKDNDNNLELVTPPLDGTILGGITRDSVLGLTREWNEFKVSERNMTMPQLRDAIKSGNVVEMFGCGTACVVSPIKTIGYMGEVITKQYCFEKNQDLTFLFS